MKKILSIIMTFVMLTAITNSMTKVVFAADSEQEANENDTTTITYEVAPTYLVTISSEVVLGQTEPATISVENVLIEKGKQIEVAITDTNEFKVKSAEGAELTYTIRKGNTTLNAGDTVLTVNPDNAQSGSVEISFDAPTNIKYAGKYTGTITYTISVTNAD